MDRYEDPSQAKQDEQVFSRMRFLETAALVPLGVIGVFNARADTEYQGFDLKSATFASEEKDQFGAGVLRGHLARLENAANNLSKQYTIAYEETDLVPGLDMEGNPTVSIDTSFNLPEGYTTRAEVKQWHAFSSDIRSKIDFLQSDTIVDPDRLRDVAIEAKGGSKVAQTILSSLAYGALGVGAIAYEEAYAHLTKNGYRSESYRERLREISTPKRMHRRDMLKFGAAAVGAFVGLGVSQALSAEEGEARGRMEDHLVDSGWIGEQESEALIEQYFGVSSSSSRTSTSKRLYR